MVSSISANRLLQAYKVGNDVSGSTQQQPGQRDDVDVAQKSNESVQVNLSAAAQSKLTLSKAVRAGMEQHQQAKKARARERVAEVKKRIDELKKMLMMFGGMAPKALLRELKQLAGELKGAAKDLQEGGSAASSTSDMPLTANFDKAVIGETADDSLVVADAPSDPIVAVPALPDDAEIVGDNGKHTEEADRAVNLQQKMPSAVDKARRQRQEDQRMLQETASELQSLFNMLKAMLRNDDKDKDTEKQLDEISSLIDDTKQSALQLSNGVMLGIDAIAIV
ncbi:DNA-binding transcriptional MerR regulator [Rheinheimera pacifica]|uniref:hypothetical protein n=1 Tax=Rheinheimera pacifica TaxID=173990 RepID=UPI0028608CC4|nr:hypothetical protein [Rheinheimera pacifica]MDR6984150.1 DNA-binding transcriptional MerR regulator [Rheinheimera pacifica]